MNREEALKHASRAHVGIMVGIGTLIWASLHSRKAAQYLQGVLPRDRIVSVADQAPQDTKEALEEVLENYAQSVN